MKKISFSFAVMLLGLSSLAVKAAAQNRPLAQTNIPFAFSAEGLQLSAGDYELWQIGDKFVRLQNLATKKGVTLLCHQGNIVASDAVKIVFRVYDTDHFLAGVVAPSYQISLPKSQSEKQVEASAATAKTVALKGKH